MRRLKKMLYVVLALVGVLVVGAYGYIQHPKFGDLPEGDRLQKVAASPNYSDGVFRNLVDTPMFTGDIGVIVGNLFNKPERLVPDGRVPTVKTDLTALDRDSDVVIWLGHSSYFVQLGGKQILIDPVFSANAAPVPYANEAFPGANSYTVDDIPPVDVLLITHDHWDHLDYPTLTALEPKVETAVTGLGVGAYLEGWGYAREKIRETDWNTTLELDDGLTVHVLPARHYSGRMLTRNKTLCVGFALETPEQRVFFSGDSGYGPHFQEIGQRFGGFDLVALDHGQYDDRWAYIHMTPEEAVQAAEDLGARALLPGHVGKFTIARHSWDEPFKRIVEASTGRAFRLLTPMIGEAVALEGPPQSFSPWWSGVEHVAVAD